MIWALSLILTAVILRAAYRDAKKADAESAAFKQRFNQAEIARAKGRAS